MKPWPPPQYSKLFSCCRWDENWLRPVYDAFSTVIFVQFNIRIITNKPECSNRNMAVLLRSLQALVSNIDHDTDCSDWSLFAVLPENTDLDVSIHIRKLDLIFFFWKWKKPESQQYLNSWIRTPPPSPLQILVYFILKSRGNIVYVKQNKIPAL